jgi:hypothetical protein
MGWTGERGEGEADENEVCVCVCVLARGKYRDHTNKPHCRQITPSPYPFPSPEGKRLGRSGKGRDGREIRDG